MSTAAPESDVIGVDWIRHVEDCIECEASTCSIIVDMLAVMEGGMIWGPVDPADFLRKAGWECPEGLRLLREGAREALDKWRRTRTASKGNG